ncbi:MAG: hypothetical protein AB1Z98_06635 [Nannocystaceae bacterium]
MTCRPTDHTTRHRVVGLLVGLAVGLALSLGCAGKRKGSRSPEQCMTHCEQEQCAYDPYSTDNDEYLECLEACQDDCA